MTPSLLVPRRWLKFQDGRIKKRVIFIPKSCPEDFHSQFLLWPSCNYHPELGL